ncbi:MAG: hypothetical protein ACREDP_14710, partial [Bradyrhizobium sp.]
FSYWSPSESAGCLVSPAPEWFHGWIKIIGGFLADFLAGFSGRIRRKPTDITERLAWTTMAMSGFGLMRIAFHAILSGL